MMRIFWAVPLLWPCVALAHDWQRLDGLAIADLVIGHGIVIGHEVQRYDSGGTVRQGAASGRWQLARNGLCHTLSGDWACFAVLTQHGEVVRLVDESGHTVEGAMVP